jgi:FkbM family methyltransferase
VPSMASILVSARRRLPKRLRNGALRMLGRRPARREPERIFELALPGTPPRRLTIRTPRRTYVSRLLEEAGLAGYEPDTLACFLAAIDECGAAPVYDVGANIGVFSWLAAALTPAAVVGFEPTPDLAAQLRSIRDANGLAIQVEEVALGAAPGTAELFLSDKTENSNSLRAGFRPSHRSVWVEVETVDRYVARTATAPAVLKVDTESTEPDVLRGAAELLATGRPWIICEVLAGRTEADLTAILEPLGYSWYRIDGPGPLEPRSTIEGDSAYVHLNWLFAPEPPSDSFWRSYARWQRSIAALGD